MVSDLDLVALGQVLDLVGLGQLLHLASNQNHLEFDDLVVVVVPKHLDLHIPQQDQKRERGQEQEHCMQPEDGVVR